MKKNIGKAIAIIGGLILIIGIVFIAQEKFQSPTPQNPDQGSEGGKPGKPGGEYVGGDIEDIQYKIYLADKKKLHPVIKPRIQNNAKIKEMTLEKDKKRAG